MMALICYLKAVSKEIIYLSYAFGDNPYFSLVFRDLIVSSHRP